MNLYEKCKKDLCFRDVLTTLTNRGCCKRPWDMASRRRTSTNVSQKPPVFSRCFKSFFASLFSRRKLQQSFSARSLKQTRNNEESPTVIILTEEGRYIKETSTSSLPSYWTYLPVVFPDNSWHQNLCNWLPFLMSFRDYIMKVTKANNNLRENLETKSSMANSCQLTEVGETCQR